MNNRMLLGADNERNLPLLGDIRSVDVVRGPASPIGGGSFEAWSPTHLAHGARAPEAQNCTKTVQKGGALSNRSVSYLVNAIGLSQ
jgi:hypothetical protein